MREPTDIIIEIGKQVPALALMVFVIWIFMKYLGTRDNMMRSLFEEHVDERHESRKVIEDNTKALRENAETRGSVTEALRRLHEKL